MICRWDCECQWRGRKTENRGRSAVIGETPGEMIVLKDETGFAGKEIEREMLNTIIHMRVRETFELLKRELEPHSFLPYLGAGLL
jgi:cell division protein FtsA